MATDAPTQDRTEAPTQFRRDEARRKGQIANSNDLNSGVILLVGAGALWMAGPDLARGWRFWIQRQLSNLPTEWSTRDAENAVQLFIRQGLSSIAILAGILFFAGLGAGILQAGIYVSPQALEVRWNRLSPLDGWKRVVSLAGVVRAFIALSKVAVCVAVVWWVVEGRIPQMPSYALGDLDQSMTKIWELLLQIVMGIAGAFLVLGLADYAFQRWQHERSLMMTRQEMLDEIKHQEGDPEMQARRRSQAREIIAGRAMLEEIPAATVVLTNPTQLAVALRYQPGVTTAPEVIAKGAGETARRIVVRARRHSVPVVERRPVARALFRQVEVGEEIPPHLYYVVSEVIAYVYRLRGVA